MNGENKNQNQNGIQTNANSNIQGISQNRVAQVPTNSQEPKIEPVIEELTNQKTTNVENTKPQASPQKVETTSNKPQLTNNQNIGYQGAQTPSSNQASITKTTSSVSNQPQATNIQSPSTNQNNVASGNNQSQLNEKVPAHLSYPMKEVEIKNKDQSGNGKYILTILLFVLLFSVVLFLPNITSYINLHKNRPEEKITSGDLVCDMDNSTDNLDIFYKMDFSFRDNKLKKLTSTIKTKGDQVVDKDELKGINDKCKLLVSATANLSGVSVTCSLNNGTNEEKQIFTYQDIESEKITSAYSEAGGIYPDFAYNDNIDDIEIKMKQAGYTCNRER